MKTAKITEVFFSLQGEGPYVGTGHVFVRFAGCNIKCRYCDTQKQRYKEYDVKALIFKVKNLLSEHKAGYLSLTGGEPLLQAEFIFDFLKKARLKKTCVYLETNGILYDNFRMVLGLMDVVSLDIKLPSAAKTKAFWAEHREFLKLCIGKKVFAKAVITVSTVNEDIRKLVRMLKEIDKTIPLIIQPDFNGMGQKLVNKAMRFQKYALQYLTDVRVIPQVHRFLNIR
ncbi:MAG: 7-carboxy-7-deazaguanine synthase QueE [Candidatus Omnitrophica bacterium]|nr:7-carboxy-7-deazaguanine synthase QueE [Candidatus Omnitrophota bacterium]